MKKENKKRLFKRMLVIIFSIILGVFFILTCIVLAYSPGKIQPYLNDTGKVIPGSISEKTFVKIGGVEQGMFVKSKNIKNPVLLYVHGGPAFQGEGEGKEFDKQAKDFIENIMSPEKSLRIFTNEEGAGSHCQVDNHRLMNEVVIIWLNKLWKLNGQK